MDFIDYSVLCRIQLHTRNLALEVHDHLRYSKEKTVFFPPLIRTDVVEKIANRASLRGSEFRFQTRGKQYRIETGWTPAVSSPAPKFPLPCYTSNEELQFMKFLLASPGELVPTGIVNPTLSEVRRYCIQNPIRGALFRGAVEAGKNYLGVHPGHPYWVNIPRDGHVVVRSRVPDLLDLPAWRKMQLNWLGKVILETN